MYTTTYRLQLRHARMTGTTYALLDGIASFFMFSGALDPAFRLTRSACTLELYPEGFTIQKHGRFNVLPKKPVRQRWSDFSYQSGALYGDNKKLYELSIHLKNGTSFSFLTGTSPKEKAEIEHLHQEIDQRVALLRNA